MAFRFLHDKLEKSCPSGTYENILEIGSNNGEHIEFVPASWKSYVALDLKLPDADIISKFKDRDVNFLIGDAQDLNFSDIFFDRCISTCVLHHVNSVETVLRELLRVTKLGGVITIAVPNDPGILYRAARYFTSVRRARKANLVEELNLVHALEHRNHFLAIDSILKWVFENQEVRIMRYPNVVKFWQMNFLTVYAIKKIK
jgi:SAM-dependent methyltransferase